MTVFDAAGGATFIDYASKGGVVALLVVIIYGGFKKEPWWVFGWVYRDLLTRYEHRGQQIDKWWELARQATITAKTLSDTKLPADGGESGER